MIAVEVLGRVRRLHGRAKMFEREVARVTGLSRDTGASSVVAIAAKNARMAWAVLTKGESFKLPA